MSVAALDTHPVPSCVRSARESFSAVPTSAWDGLETGEVRRLVGELSRLESQVAAHKMAAARVLEKARTAAANGDGPRPGTGTSTGATISIDFGGDRSGADALVNTAQRIEEQTTLTENALASGVISSKQADLISRALAKLPDDVTPEQRERCEETLLRDAQRLSLKDLRRRGDRITQAYRKKTDEVDADEDAILRKKEEAARAKTSFSMWDNNDGTVTGRFTLPEAQGAMLKTALDALAAPHQKVGTVNAATGEHDEVGFGQTYPQRLGHAFATLIEHLPADSLPSNGGVSAVVTVNLDLDTLMGGVKAAGGEATGLQRPDRPDGPQRHLTPDRPRQREPLLQPVIPPGDGEERRRMHHTRLRPRLTVDRSPPPHPLLPERDHRRQRRRTPVLVPPPPRPRAGLGRADQSR
ncbi:hypothetical protein ASF37_10155 [Aeromicrobium sp. Leaf289]|uniref:DUF222 domain-containing protein n=1 Tax=Aeromicrobium sp. Leaf289 TaxID=1736324 RepID=UPI0007002E26|nr:DUF222 domain-containing protein [Aeromicrobium sp. Leaf289]KQP78855.1 hypothetical protein ASF37_10155 [Aeromicrobium sp. Leaf289]